MKYFQIFLLFCCYLQSNLSTAKIIKTQPCSTPTNNAEIISVDVSPCRRTPCKLKKGTTYTLTITFKSLINSNQVTSKVCGKVGPVCVPFKLPNEDSCSQMTQGVCPVKENETYVFQTSLPIKSIYPSMSVTGKWRLIGEEGDLLCFNMDLKIVDAAVRKMIDSNEIFEKL